MAITFGTLCSGIGCADLAATALGWQNLYQSEIDRFACALLARRFPGAINLGDMTKLADGPDRWRLISDVLIAGTPCQSFSIAGLQRSLDDDRGNLTLELVRMLNRTDENRAACGLETGCTLVWENVPGILSTHDNAFGCFLAALVGADEPIAPFGRRKGWARAGLVRGPRRSAAWRILDAQWFGVAQRRKRLFLVAGSGDRFDPSAVLLEPESMRRNRPSREEAGKGTTGTLAARASAGGGLGTDFDLDGGLVPAFLHANKGRPAGRKSPHTKMITVEIETVPTISTDGHNASAVAYSIQERAVSTGNSGPDGVGVQESLAYTLESRTKVQAIAYRTSPNCGVWETGDRIDALTTSTNPCSHVLAYGGNNTSGPLDVAASLTRHPSGTGRLDFASDTFLVAGGDVSHALNSANNGKHCSEDGTGRGVPIIAFSCKDSGADASEISPTLRAMNFSGSHANAGGQIAIAFHENQRAEISLNTTAGSLNSGGGKPGQGYPATFTGSAVRRLMPIECERLQGLPDNWTRIPIRWYQRRRITALRPADMWEPGGNEYPGGGWWLMAADGPRYKAIGNGMAVPCMLWILDRLECHLKGELKC